MKFIISNNKKILKISKKEWEKIGKDNNWIKKKALTEIPNTKIYEVSTQNTINVKNRLKLYQINIDGIKSRPFSLKLFNLNESENISILFPQKQDIKLETSLYKPYLIIDSQSNKQKIYLSNLFSSEQIKQIREKFQNINKNQRKGPNHSDNLA